MSRSARRFLVVATAASLLGAVVALPIIVSSAAVAGAAVPAPLITHASGSPSWSLLRNPLSPLSPSEDALASVSCTSGVQCMAVGSGYNTALAEKWNGSRWLIVPTPAPRGRVLQGISCPTAKRCMAVGYSSNDPNGLSATTLAESWNGSHWTAVPTPNRGRILSTLDSVSCTSATNCIAVGFEGSGQNLAPLAERWDGTRWSVMPTIAPVGAVQSGLFAITCISFQNCIATGASSTRSSTVPLAEHWDGRAWSIMSVPAPAGAESYLIGISCVSPRSCHAVGVTVVDSLTDFTESTLAERWNGSKWSIVASPNVPGGAGSFFTQVSCKTASNCSAVGGAESFSASDEGAAKPLTAHWNGRGWSRVRSAAQPGVLQSTLNGIACPGVNNCAAVGGSLGRTTNGEIPHAERWNGSKWSVVPAQHRPGPHSATLSAVSCVSTGQCRAVGESASGALIERFNGRSWAIMKTASTPGRFGYLDGISCVTASACVAVGGAFGARDGVPLAERWDGRRWTRMPVPAPIGKTDSALTSVSCSRSDNCVAVGSAYDLNSSGFAGDALVERWNGKKWSIVQLPLPSGAVSPQLTAVSCAAPNSCVAVGSYFAQAGPRALIEHWNGKKWSVVAGPKAEPGAFGVQLSGVSCPAVGDCTAVGSVYGSTGTRPIVEHSNGTTWSEVASPDLADRNTFSGLTAVSCASTKRCTAIGSIQRFTSGDFTVNPAGVLTERWDGTSWTVVPSPDVPDSISHRLSGISCRPNNTCVGVGAVVRAGNGAQQALAEALN